MLLSSVLLHFSCPCLILVGALALASSSSSSSIAQVATAGRLAELATPLAVPRPVGSAGHELVRRRLVEFLQQLGGFDVQLDSFEAETPLGRRSFDNIVATTGSSNGRRLVLAAHYDSKLFRAASGAGGGSSEFVGATDSAVPCAMLLLLAETLTALTGLISSSASSSSSSSSPQLGLQLLFFDGEEALERWTRSDSLYGSRHLANRWSADNDLGDIEALVLLDLIGGRDPRFYYNPHPASAETVVAKEMRLFDELVSTETELRADGQLSHQHHRYFQAHSLGSGPVQDDQTPFQEAGVPVVHVIPQPFPQVWHTTEDNLNAVQFDQAADVAKILLAWTAQKIGLAAA